MKKSLKILCILLLFGCNHNNNKVIPPDDLTKILTELHLADALKKDHSLGLIYEHPDSINFQEAIWAKYNYTKADYDSTMKWYAEHPKKLNDIFQKVLARLSEMEQPVNEQLPDKDSLIYQDSTTYSILDNEMAKNTEISFPNVGIGEYIIRALVKVNETDRTKRLGMLVYKPGQRKSELFDSNDNFRRYIKDGNKRAYSISIVIRDTGTDKIWVDLLYSPDNGPFDKINVEFSEVTVKFRP